MKAKDLIPLPIRKLIPSSVKAFFSTTPETAPAPVSAPVLENLNPYEAYHKWLYDSYRWDTMTWLGVKTLKSPSDMWNYQEIIFSLNPTIIIEFGTRHGGSALFWSSLADRLPHKPRVLSVDVDWDTIHEKTKRDPNIEIMIASSSSPEVGERIRKLREENPGPVFIILDSDHSKDHVLGELLLLHPLLQAGDYVIVEDTNINGHPVLPDWGPGPYEALEEYLVLYPDDFVNDIERETKFGFTFAPRGFLIRK